MVGVRATTETVLHAAAKNIDTLITVSSAAGPRSRATDAPLATAITTPAGNNPAAPVIGIAHIVLIATTESEGNSELLSFSFIFNG